jgi:hypothetical protein
MYKSIIKIDACGSKEYVASSRCIDPQSMRRVLFSKICEIAKEVYPDSEKEFPEGSLYSGQGDCIYILLDNPDYAIRATIDFLKKWYEAVSEYPDCRAVIDFDDVNIYNSVGRVEVLSEALENVNIIEKCAGKGEIIVTKKIYELLKTKMAYRFIDSGSVEIKQRTIEIYKVDYENPRTVEDDYLVQTIFIADEKSDLLRDRSICLLVLNYLVAKRQKVTLSELLEHIKSSENIDLGKEKIISLIRNNEMFTLENCEISISKNYLTKISAIREDYNTSKHNCTEFIADEIGKAIGIEKRYLLDSISLDSMIEKYLVSVFNEIRMVAYFYNEKTEFYNRLKDISEFDSCLKKEYEIIRKLSKEEFSLFKESFLRALAKLTGENNKYIASIFHNVLSNYYLNRNDRYLLEQIKKLKQKKYYIDTNILYSYLVKSSQYNSITTYVIKKLLTFEAEICIFDKSINEYNDSLMVALHAYENNINLSPNLAYVPWITHEYVSHPNEYGNSFEYCVKLHSIDLIGSIEENKDFLKRKYSLILEILEPFKDKRELGELYDLIYSAKSSNLSSDAILNRNPDSFEAKVLHDANCIGFINQIVDDPTDASSLFVTCDFRLASVRKKIGKTAKFIITIEELYEYLLPYLLINENLIKNPITVPNLLLASAIDIELGNTDPIESVVGNYLTKSAIPQNYKLLLSIKQKNRFTQIARKLEESRRSNDIEGYRKTEIEFKQAKDSYVGEIAEQLVRTLTATELKKKDITIDNLRDENEKLMIRVGVLEKKKKGEEKYKKRMKNKKKK